MKARHLPRPVVRLAMRLLARRNDALASVLGAGMLQDLRPARWDDTPLTARGIEPTATTDFLREQAEQSGQPASARRVR